MNMKRKREDNDETSPEKNQKLVTTSRCIFNTPPPVPHNLYQIYQFLKRHSKIADIEIEVKLGVLIFKGADNLSTAQRVNPVQTEGLVTFDQFTDIYFLADVGSSYLGALNNKMNNLFRDLTGSMKYTHTTLKDTFYKINDTKYRLTQKYNKETKEYSFVECVAKERLEDLTFHAPQFSLDYRLSAQQEIQIDNEGIPRDAVIEMTREKDRISYAVEIFSFDLTKVIVMRGDPTNPQTVKNEKVTHEMEIEISDRLALGNADDKELWRIAEALLNNLRHLASVRVERK